MRKVLMSMILMLLLAVCVGTASAAVTVTTSFGADNPAFGGSGQQASDPNSDDDDDLFVNVSDLHPSVQPKRLAEGQSVKFDIKSDMKGDKAVNVRVVK